MLNAKRSTRNALPENRDDRILWEESISKGNVKR
jgi:hypothetical protein